MIDNLIMDFSQFKNYNIDSETLGKTYYLFCKSNMILDEMKNKTVHDFPLKNEETKSVYNALAKTAIYKDSISTDPNYYPFLKRSDAFWLQKDGLYYMYSSLLDEVFPVLHLPYKLVKSLVNSHGENTILQDCIEKTKHIKEKDKKGVECVHILQGRLNDDIPDFRYELLQKICTVVDQNEK